MAQSNLLVLNAELEEATVYVITRAIFERLDVLHGAHPATEALAIEQAIDGLPMALHPGAARLFGERGVALPRVIGPFHRLLHTQRSLTLLFAYKYSPLGLQ